MSRLKNYMRVEGFLFLSPILDSLDRGSALSKRCWSLDKDGGFSGTAGWIPSMLSQWAGNKKGFVDIEDVICSDIGS